MCLEVVQSHLWSDQVLLVLSIVTKVLTLCNFATAAKSSSPYTSIVHVTIHNLPTVHAQIISTH